MRIPLRIGVPTAAAAVAALALIALAPAGSVHAGVFLFDASPDSDTNPVGTDHTVDALVTVGGVGNPVQGAEVTFIVITGPNAGDNGGGTTDIDGMTSFTYTGDGGAGQDQIEVCLLSLGLEAAGNGAPLDCEVVTKDWVEPTPTPTPVPTEAAPIAEEPEALPETGTDPGGGSSFPLTLVIALAAGGIVLGAGGLIAARRR